MDLPEISTEVVESFYAILLGMEVDLDADPLQFGPKRLNGKIAKARGMLTESESLYLQVSMWLQKYRSIHRGLELELDIQKKHLFANDPEVRAGRNVADREALATMKLQNQVREIARVARAQESLEYLIKAIRSKKADLKDVQGRLRDQIKLCQEELGLGQRWGSKPAPGRGAPDLEAAPNVDKQTLKDLHEMFKGTGTVDPDLYAVASEPDGSEASPTPEDGVPTPEDGVPTPEDGVPTPEDGEGRQDFSDGMADDFLSAISTSQNAPAKHSIEDLLDGLNI